MHIVLLCATERGLRFLDHLAALIPGEKLTIFTFPEAPGEPLYVDRITTRARQVGAEVIVTREVGGVDAAEFWKGSTPDLMIAVCWRYLIPSRIFSRPLRGSVVFHDSLLPTYRGFAPTVWAMINGESKTGATLFHMADEIDSGDLIDQREVLIGIDDTIADVMANVTHCYLELLTSHLPKLVLGTATRHPQDHSRATYTCKRLPSDNRIDWTTTTDRVYNLIRGTTTPYPGAFTTYSGRRLTIWAARRAKPIQFVGRIPGRIVKVLNGLGAEVLTGDGSLILTTVQFEGEERVCASQVLHSLATSLGR